MSIENQVSESLDRLRRVETRLTMYLVAQGFDVMTQRPTWKDGEVHIPSLGCSIRDIMSVVPPEWLEQGREVDVVHKSNYVISLCGAEVSNEGE